MLYILYITYYDLMSNKVWNGSNKPPDTRIPISGRSSDHSPTLAMPAFW